MKSVRRQISAGFVPKENEMHSLARASILKPCGGLKGLGAQELLRKY